MTPDTSAGKNLPPLAVTVKTAAQLLGMSPWRVTLLCRSGAIESHHEGHRRFVSLASLNSYAGRTVSDEVWA